ncbi:MAG TPA: glycoside hydrolase family 3 C-terminal domain-containing protein [Verrucomicrobiae bacterium]|jgi:beta-glucosidase|nr:glycoside hydrolase family 3 C-terminal domain-containing protein [Verrucomicrobiae bacterium]
MIRGTDELSRREFLSTLAATAGLLACGLTPDIASAEIFSFGKRAERIGISDAAYQAAWKRAKQLVDQMTLKEKIGQLGSRLDNAPGAEAVRRLNIPAYSYYSGEALHGLLRSAPVTTFPVPLALAATWNPGLILRIYTAISDEARAYDNRDKIGLSYYSPPTLNLHRDPRWGRCQEAPGEDPCLAGTIAVQMVRGMQGDNPHYLKTTACSKHFICNNAEHDRTRTSAAVDARSFWEYYTRAYRTTVVEGDVFTLMGAYNAVNGIPCCADRFLLTELLREQWGFRGYVTSDCGAIGCIHDQHHYAGSLPIAAAMAIQAGCELDCGGTLQSYLKQAVDQELISEGNIDLAVTRLLTVRHLLGLFDPPEKVPYTQIPFSVVDSPAHRALALEAARQSLVLLKNDSQFLPLDKTAIKKIAVIGPLAGSCILCGYSGAPSLQISPYQGIAEHLGVVADIPDAGIVANSESMRIQSSSEGRTDLTYIDNGSWAEYSKADFTGKSEIQARVSSAAAKGCRIDLHLDRLDGPLACTLTAPGTGSWEKWINISAPLTGITGEHSIFLKFRGGKGHLLDIEQLQLHPLSPTPANPGSPEVVLKPGCAVIGGKDEKMFQDALEAARTADVVVLVCGVNEEVGGEGHDRDTIGLTGAQPALIQAVYAVNPKTVLVLSTNNTVAINWEQEHLPAILCAVCAGQAQGTAIAEALFGEYNPGGKLPCTWYRSLNQLPDMDDYDIHKGRTYMYFEGDPLYPFGHGLSYTTFKLDRLEIEGATLGEGEKTKILLDVTNTGNHFGSEVVQLYITPPASPVKRPGKQLAGFQRVELQPGEKRTVVFELRYSEQAFWYWDEKTETFVIQPGTAKILAGNSSANILLAGELTLKHPDTRRLHKSNT